MSYLVAAQSALFYFLACTPCTKVMHVHKTNQQAKREREEKARVVMEQPHLYQQPDPFQTNPYWQEEIRMGPSLPKKGKGGDRASHSMSQRRLTAASRDGGASIGAGNSFVINMGSPPGSISGPRPSTSLTISPTINTSRVGSTPTVVNDVDIVSPTLSQTVSVSTADDWNTKPYQREDEGLWGQDIEVTRKGQKIMDALKQAGSSAGRFVESKFGLEKQVTEEDRYNFYCTPRNPPVNEYHPPVVSSKPAHKGALHWMLQPPPPAKVMEGKVPVSRSGSLMSVQSRRTVSTMATMDGRSSLGRIVGEKAFEARVRRGETPYDGELRSSASLSRTKSRRTVASTVRTRSGRTARGNSFSTESDDSSEEFERQRRRRRNRRPVFTPEVNSDEESEPKQKISELSPAPATHAALRPKLSTIMSSGDHVKSVSSQTDKTSPVSHASPLQEVTNAEPTEPSVTKPLSKVAIAEENTTQNA
ncbi:hypothetical protein QBC35DRAFT_70133 [Podospora australis]|uniref:Uncharacterized protein n=1 Tax=Podospora australis TaxID=1536484 RepID=A0AAN6WYE4_9PEZI|nr:hypothetical protein QBC35DRAFT_70133 [Podospora australis]